MFDRSRVHESGSCCFQKALEKPVIQKKAGFTKLRPRLEAALSMLGAQQVLADIGCDHGRFGITALRRGLCSRVIASDISAPSLEKARRLADKEALRNRIEFRCCDGLTGYAPGEATGAALLGMGGELIASILERGKEAAHGFSRIVMQPMRGEAELRKHLYENGYAVRDECVVFDAGRYYQLIAAEYAPDESSSLPSDWPEDYYQFGPVAFNKREAELLPMLKRYKAVMGRKLAAAARNGSVPPALKREAECTKRIIELYPADNTEEITWN